MISRKAHIGSFVSIVMIVLLVSSDLKAEPKNMEQYLNQFLRTSNSKYVLGDINSSNPYNYDYEIDSSVIVHILAIDTAFGKYWFAISLYTQEGERINNRYISQNFRNINSKLGWIDANELLDQDPTIHNFDVRFNLEEYQRIKLWIEKRRLEIRTEVVADWLFPISPENSFKNEEEFELVDSMTFYIDYEPKYPDTLCFMGQRKTVSIPQGTWIKFGNRPDVRYPHCYVAYVYLKPSSFKDSLEMFWGWRNKSGLGGYVDGRQLRSNFGTIDTISILRSKSEFMNNEYGLLEEFYRKYSISRIEMDSIETEARMKHWKDDDNIGFTDARIPRKTLFFNDLRPPEIIIEKMPNDL